MEPEDVPCPSCHATPGAPCSAVKRGRRTVKVPASGHHIVRASKARAASTGAVSPAAAMVTRTDAPKLNRKASAIQGVVVNDTLLKGERVALGTRLRALSLGSYRDYLRSAHWQHFSTMVATPYRNCHVCGRTGGHLHHLDYSTLGREQPEDVVPLCNDHHEIVHSVHVLEWRPLATCHVVVRQRHAEGTTLIQPRSRSQHSPAA